MDNIAVIGMGCLFPDYADKEKFWDVMIRGETFLTQDSFMGKPVERSGLPRSGSEAFFSTFESASAVQRLSQINSTALLNLLILHIKQNLKRFEREFYQLFRAYRRPRKL